MRPPAVRDPARPPLRRLAFALWFTLLVLCVAWEAFLAPLRPGGSWLVLKALPLALLAPGVARGALKPMQVAVLIVLLYVAEGAVRLADGATVARLAAAELLLAVGFFCAAVAYLAPFKRAARQRRQEEGMRS
jgi:uncharacterized membrane protein